MVEVSNVKEMLEVNLCQISDVGIEITMNERLRRWPLQLKQNESSLCSNEATRKKVAVF